MFVNVRANAEEWDNALELYYSPQDSKEPHGALASTIDLGKKEVLEIPKDSVDFVADDDSLEPETDPCV